MRQKDVDRLAEIWSADIEDADHAELHGYEMAIGALIKPLKYATDPRHPLDLSALVTLTEQCRAGQKQKNP